jgi:hypothetical protein
LTFEQIKLCGGGLIQLLATIQQQYTGMLPQEYDDNRQHQDGIKDIKRVLVGEKPSGITHKILNHSKDASYENNAACEVKVVHMLAPGDFRRGRQAGRDYINAIMKKDCGNKKDSEGEYLD